MKAELVYGVNDVLNEEEEATYEYDRQKLFDNTAPRCPVVLLIDTSGSMGYGKLYNGIKPIDEVNKGINDMFKYVRNDYVSSKRAEIAIITFSSQTTLISDFSLVDGKKDVNLTAGGVTTVAPALKLMMNMLEERKKKYKSAGRKYYRPIVIMMTDGGPGDVSQFNEMKDKIRQATIDNKLTFHAVKVGTEENLENHKKHFNMLQGFDHQIPAGLLDVDKIDKFFEWLSKSIEQRSKSKDSYNDVTVADPTPWWNNIK